ncbi:rotatin isoform X3 [Polyodon spathula]|uniref:rotatin isoform X3 n=1 Tax=Polyodon spathula TaxID=7913 RepID=UPI001B7EA628|nr:rotatin isoform X3 [Polyodon spathula]
MELSTLIKKLGHQLVEIRERALRNIMCKLDHGLISVPDLVQEKKLFVCLLEWFNFPEVPMQGEVLELLCRLVKHPSAAHLLGEVGAVEFLTQLRSIVEPKRQATIDGILDGLFQLPEIPPDFPAISFHGKSAVLTEQKAMPPIQAEDETPLVGYFQNITTRPSEIPPQRIAVSDSVKCLKFSTFPWLALMTTDRHILSSSESSLRSNNHSLVRRTCKLLQDVIMQDFPAEIFLQRPKIVQNLLSLLKLNTDRDSASYLTLQAVSCLRQLCTNLRSRLSFHRDPSFFSAKQDVVSQNSSVSYSQETRGTQQSPENSSPRPSVIGRTGQRARGDGQDGDAASSSGSSSQGANSRLPTQSPLDTAHLDLPEMENEDILELQFQQLGLAQFCVAVLEHALPLFRTESMKVFLCVLELLSENILLLKDSISEEVWVDDSIIGWELKDKLLSSLDSLGDTLFYHLSNSSSDQSEPILVNHRLAYTGTAVFTVRLLQTLVPVEKASEVLPESTGAALFHLSLDLPFSMAFQSIHESAAAYLEQLNSENYSVYKCATRTVHSIECTCSFLKEVKMEGKKNLLELLELADQAVGSLSYHQHLPLVKEITGLCSHIWKSAQASPILQAESQKCFLKLLSHPLLAVKVETYACSLNIVKECLGIHNVTKPVSSICHGVHFLLHARVLYEICTFGLQDPEEQGYAGTEGTLGTCILQISETANETGEGILPRTARLRAALRLLFSKQQMVRAVAVKHLMWHLANEEGASTKHPVLEGGVLSTLSALFVVDKPIDMKLDDIEKSYFKVESVTKIYAVLTSETVDIVLRKSAAEQLAVIMQDTTMHAALKSLGVIEQLFSFISECVTNNGKSKDCLLLPCLSLLRKLVYADPLLRHSLAQQPSLLLVLLRASLIVKENKGNTTEAAALICLLLFDEVARMDIWIDNPPGCVVPPSPFSIPVTVVRRYNLPFHVMTHHLVSPYCTVLPPSSDPLTVKPAWDMLKCAWNRAWYNGIDLLLEQMMSHEMETEEFLDRLKLSPVESLMLKVTHVTSGLQDCLDTINSAVAHGTVSSVLTRMRFYLLSDKLALKQGSDSSKSMLKTLEWRAALSRFLQVLPACTDDEKLLVDVVVFLNQFFKHQSETDSEDLQWILEVVLKQPLLNVLVRTESQVQSEAEEIQTVINQRLQKELTGFFNTVLHLLTSVTDRKCLILAGPFRTHLAAKLLQCLRVSDAPHFYGLPSLERTLQGMVHVTVLPGWSLHSPTQEPDSLCAKYLTGLLEVISSFYVEWGGNAMSFMGKGVTKSAVHCLLQLSHEMIAQAKAEDWISSWSLAYDQNTDEQAATRLGLAWLIPLWFDRDPEVRFASLGIGSALTSVESGCIALAASCQNISGGLWGTVLNILLDQLECSMVRREAAFILQNLLVIPMPANIEEAKDFAWQSPCVHDEDSGLSLVGLPALQALLYHCQFFEHASQIVKTCFLGRHSFDLNYPRASNTLTANITEDFDDTMKHWRGPSSLPDHSQISSSLSTSSTLVLPEDRAERQISAFSVSMVHAPDTPTNRLMAQGQSDTDTSSLSTEDSRMAGMPQDHCVIVTPPLLSAICGLLTNLLAVLPEFTLSAINQYHILSSLTSLVDASLLERCFWELRSSSSTPDYREDIKAQVLSLLQYISCFSGLLQSCLIINHDIINQEDVLKPLLTNVFAILSPHLKDHFDAEVKSTLYHTWTDLFMLMATLLRKNSQITFPYVSTALRKHWTSFTGTISACVQLSTTDSFLYTSALQFLSVVLSEEAKRQIQDSTQLSSVHNSVLTELLNESSGSQLCELILQSFEGKSSEDVLKKIAACTLMSLLAVSSSARMHALHAGLVDSCVEQMKQSHAQLNLDSLKPGKAAQRKKEESVTRELKMAMQILRNCLYRSDECKVAATDTRLVNVVHALWSWFLTDDVLMQAALQLLCVYTANCPTACGSLCWGNGVQSASQRGPASNSLVHSIMKLASQKAPENSSIQQLSFALLSNLAISHDCKGAMQKSNFLQNFVTLSLSKSGSKTINPLVNLWLKLLLNMSFGEDGQQMILKIHGVLDLLTEMLQYKSRSSKPVTLLILHNICFSAANKPKLLAHDKTVEVLSACLESNFPDVQAIGASALWALLHNFQKAKVTLKSPTIKRRVDEALTLAKKDSTRTDEDPMISYKLKCLENLTQILNS